MERDLMIRKNNLNIYKAVDFDEFIYVITQIPNIYNTFTETFREKVEREFKNYRYINFNDNGIQVSIYNGEKLSQSVISLFIQNDCFLDTYYQYFREILKSIRTSHLGIYDKNRNVFSQIDFVFDGILHQSLRVKKDLIDYFSKYPEYKPDKIYISKYSNDYKTYKKLLKIVKEHQLIINGKNIKNLFINSKINPLYKNQTLEQYDLSNLDFDNKNISGIDISKNPEIRINFDKIVKDLTDSNISGYNLNKYTFRNYNLTNTDLRNTGATIDIASCIINKSGKMGSGTLFDEDNKFIFYDKVLSEEQIKDLNIKIYKKTK
ncbi:MAG: pentapeptide repeat-containing protein [Bacilli bacterium]